MRNIIFATGNKDKVREINEMVGPKGIKVLSLKDIGFDEEVEETGTTFTDNAIIKAKAVADYVLNNKREYADSIVLADDSGLEIDYYDKAPGVYSHRWLGERTYPQAMQDVIDDMVEVPEEKRTCRFVCSMAAIVLPDKVLTSLETCEGIVWHEIVGDNGFGYDPFFYMPEYGCTTAQMLPDDKNKVSHRGKALRSILKSLDEYIN